VVTDGDSRQVFHGKSPIDVWACADRGGADSYLFGR